MLLEMEQSPIVQGIYHGTHMISLLSSFLIVNHSYKFFTKLTNLQPHLGQTNEKLGFPTVTTVLPSLR